MRNISEIIQEPLETGGILDALLAIQSERGYISEEALTTLSARIGVSRSQLYQTASFYSMLRFAPPKSLDIRFCRGTACHAGGEDQLLRLAEEITGVQAGKRDANRDVFIGFVECLGQCQAAPNVMINDVLYSNVTPERLRTLLKGVE
jgi:NADH:ubiquinone oxidoreductase 24 kD subunit